MPLVEVEVDVDLEDFDTDDLLDELERRGDLPVPRQLWSRFTTCADKVRPGNI